MKINLPWIKTIIDLCYPPENVKELATESFKKYTEGTAKDYQFIDKLSYLDNLRRYIHGEVDPEDAVKKIIGERVIYELEEEDRIPDTSEILCIEFMSQCFHEGFMPFKKNFSGSSRLDYTAKKTLLEIIKAVINYEEPQKDDK
ncbi:hypothetical protein [Lactococcus lactis]|jgi:hypothetical protein|uniref:Uncharacterized protein n=1 Tax=Lactococcus lactis TaxID=1358 RepID=A0A9X4NEP4_9LACT|nr:hypothetical protein [Lactococcus lactis]KST94106.1 hypothetical protein LKF24_1335 [Lactococcus lactis subsp. lactis]MDG4982074.1 hypothetical protein [Lactococcus lactis]